MKVEKVYDGIRYTLSNENLKNGDFVYPIANGRCLDNGWILHNFDFRSSISGFPNSPHKILDLKHDSYQPYEIRTDHGYGPVIRYYKIIKREEQVTFMRIPNALFVSYMWIELDDDGEWIDYKPTEKNSPPICKECMVQYGHKEDCSKKE